MVLATKVTKEFDHEVHEGTRRMAMRNSPLSDHLESLAKQALDCCFFVHSELGPGLFERVYESCLCHELETRNVPYSRQVSMPVRFRDRTFDEGFQIDVLIADAIVFELKAVETLHPRHESQLMTYLRLSGCRLGFLINFNESQLKNGIKRRVI